MAATTTTTSPTATTMPTIFPPPRSSARNSTQCALALRAADEALEQAERLGAPAPVLRARRAAVAAARAPLEARVRAACEGAERRSYYEAAAHKARRYHGHGKKTKNRGGMLFVGVDGGEHVEGALQAIALAGYLEGNEKREEEEKEEKMAGMGMVEGGGVVGGGAGPGPGAALTTRRRVRFADEVQVVPNRGSSSRRAVSAPVAGKVVAMVGTAAAAAEARPQPRLRRRPGGLFDGWRNVL
ncbi:hypothetical protein GGR56DRAFT_676795 [Xylariaceae sp. FL0804]|nr:hypothetical protein GGR56DRAFT_676795 [Xylariaceae sp. FL0804]